MLPATAIESVLERSERVLEGEISPIRDLKFKSYAITNFRGGIGKSTLTFNLAYELSLKHPTLLLDACSQRNFSQNIFGDHLYDFKQTLYDALISEITQSGIIDPEELLMPVNKGFCLSFSGNKPTYMVPGSTELFLFPSLLYGQLAQFAQIGAGHTEGASARILLSIKKIVDAVSVKAKPDKILFDTSPFFGGATHLAWMAAEALIIPVRVDQHSIEALKLTLSMLDSPTMDFHKFNKQAGIAHQPKVHAIVMTHCGWNRQKANTPDSSTRFFVERAIEVAKSHSQLFSEEDISKCFYLLDDFHSSGRISGHQRIPLAKLESGKKYMVEGQRLEVNPSVDRYKREIQNLTAAL